MKTITEAQILKLSNEAVQAGDLAQVALCDSALAGDDAAILACAKAVSDAIAADPENRRRLIRLAAKLSTLRAYSEGLWGLAIDTVKDATHPQAVNDSKNALRAWDEALKAVANGDLELAAAFLRDARSLAKVWGEDRYEREALEMLRVA